ncbi:MAG: hypothetical protein QXH02_00560 [Desulfurococcaceae archaeon]
MSREAGILLWHYKELISCPLTLVLGEFEQGGLRGYVALPLSNLRLNILVSREGDVRVVSNIPRKEWVDHLLEVCYAVFTGNVNDLDLLERVEATLMFYGGLGVYGVLDNRVVPISLDFVNKQYFYFYVSPVGGLSRNYEKAQLGDWVLLQLALREGLSNLLQNVCRHIARTSNDSCVLETSHGGLVISRREMHVDNYIRVFPDNVPLRHVVTVE